ncbi:MAG: Asd/ArgC dimerization domain-containing protein, partial [Candidatus Aminicenantales bacterium]
MRLALVGTDSLRGKELKEVLNYRNFPFDMIEFFDPDVEEEYSKLTQFRGEPRVIHHLEEESLTDSDLVFLAADKKINRRYGNLARKQKFQAIDLSETFNSESDIPLIVAGINDSILLRESPSIIANPHPVTIMLSHIFYLILQEFGLSKAVSFVLQPVSAYDESGIEELANQSFAVLNSSSLTKKVFKAQIAFNFLSHTEPMDEDGFAAAERQIMAEIKRVLRPWNLPLTLSIVQAPVFHTYSIMVYLELEKETEIQALRNLFRRSPYFKLTSTTLSSPASCVSVAGKEEIHIGQIKREKSFPNGFWIWSVADNLTLGSALNAYEIATLFVAFFTYVFVNLVQPIIDEMLQAAPQSSSAKTSLLAFIFKNLHVTKEQLIWFIPLILVIVIFGKGCFTFLSSFFMKSVGHRVVRKL